METKAVNCFTVTKELFTEGMQELLNDEYKPIAKKAIIAVAVVWLLLAAVTVYLKGRLVFTLIELAVALFVCYWLWVLVPKNRVKRAIRAQEEIPGGGERRIEFYEDRLEADKGEGETGLILNYEDVAKVLETPNLLILISVNHVGVMVSKSGFIKGDEKIVRDLLKEWSR